MSARIMVDLDHLHPVFDGRWHRVHIVRLPLPGERITTLCGSSEPAEYVADDSSRAPAATCWRCDLAYRRANNIPVLPGHPALPPGS